jgi:hypothetical protein
LAIISGDDALIDVAVDRLIGLGRHATSDVTKVHVFNILKIVLLDARQARVLPKYFERAVLLALDAFESYK